MAHDPVAELEQRQKRQTKINELEARANTWVGKFNELDQGGG